MKAQVLLPKIFNFPFTYNFKEEIKIGDLVEVPFGSKMKLVLFGEIVFQNQKI